MHIVYFPENIQFSRLPYQFVRIHWSHEKMVIYLAQPSAVSESLIFTECLYLFFRIRLYQTLNSNWEKLIAVWKHISVCSLCMHGPLIHKLLVSHLYCIDFWVCPDRFLRYLTSVVVDQQPLLIAWSYYYYYYIIFCKLRVIIFLLLFSTLLLLLWHLSAEFFLLRNSWKRNDNGVMWSWEWFDSSPFQGSIFKRCIWSPEFNNENLPCSVTVLKLRHFVQKLLLQPSAAFVFVCMSVCVFFFYASINRKKKILHVLIKTHVLQ